ncbi:MAG: SDR family NAD(P)-dependent oxidoreductase [Chlamydiales bacterium]|nr:SDR family NAD(P)-dependent oxidoreductase [Chlamydiales bacterium]
MNKEGDTTKTLVVGAASGIGRAVVSSLLDQSNDFVIAADCDLMRLKEVKTLLKAKNVSKFETLKLDISDPVSIQQTVQEIEKVYGKLDTLIVTAAIHSACPVEYLTDSMIDRVLNVNLVGHIKFVKSMLPLMQKDAHIIGVSSIAAGLTVPMESLYSASKAGLEAFYEALAVELAYRKIKVSIIHPGNVNTGFNEKGNDYQPTGNRVVDEGYKRVVKSIDSSHGMPPKEVAAVIVKALKSRRPKFCYVVGSNAMKATLAVRFLGRNLALKLIAKYFGF